jgi:uncharacterized membrane protein HdeD (DUF308 family)
MYQNNILGCPFTAFYTLLIFQIILFILSIIFSIDIIYNYTNKKKYNWVLPTIITLLVLYVLGGWYPGVGIIIFITLLSIFLYVSQNY